MTAPAVTVAATVDPLRPLRIVHGPHALTLACVSISWLRDRAADQSRLQRTQLAFDERAAIGAAWLPRRRLEWLAGRLAAKHCVLAYRRRHDRALLRPETVTIRAVAAGPRRGQPWVAGPCEVSISHSVDLAVAACAPRAVGIDVERRRTLAPPLIDVLDADGPATAAISPTLRWTCKEAVLKCAGSGLRVDAREARLRSWRADGAFEWTSGPQLASALGSHDGRLRSWATQSEDYALAVVWR